jgi:hypothetical protein
LIVAILVFKTTFAVIQVPTVSAVTPDRGATTKAKSARLRVVLVGVNPTGLPWLDVVAGEDEVLPRVTCVQAPTLQVDNPSPIVRDLGILITLYIGHNAVVEDVRDTDIDFGLRGWLRRGWGG